MLKVRYPRQLISGKDINLKEYNLGIIKQLTIDDFMGDVDIIDFLKPFFMERTWVVNETLKDASIAFTFYYMASTKIPEILSELMKYIAMLYRVPCDYNKKGNKQLTLTVVDGNPTIIIKDNKFKPIAFIDDSNFDFLCSFVLEMLHYKEPEKKEEEHYEGDADKVAMVKRMEAEYEAKHKDNKTLTFEEQVREIMHMRKCSYNEIKNDTVWQLADAYVSYMMIENSDKRWDMMISGNFKIKSEEIKDWRAETKVIQNNRR